MDDDQPTIAPITCRTLAEDAVAAAVVCECGDAGNMYKCTYRSVGQLNASAATVTMGLNERSLRGEGRMMH